MAYVNNLERDVENLAYSIANYFGLGESLNSLVNYMKKLFGNAKSATKTSTELVNYLTNVLGVEKNKVNTQLSRINNVISNLPSIKSNQMAKAVGSRKQQLEASYSKLAKKSNALDEASSTGLSLAMSQDSYKPKQKLENQQTIANLVEKAVNDK